MSAKLAVRSHETNGGAPAPRASETRPAPTTAETIRLELAEAWGEMGAAWGVTPAIARVQAYLMARQAPLTEREVREALGLSHRAASLALAEAESWGIVERVPNLAESVAAGPRASRTSPSVITSSGSAGSSPSERCAKGTHRRRARAEGQGGQRGRRSESRRWRAGRPSGLARVLRRVRAPVRSRGGTHPAAEPRELECSLQLLDRVPDATILRMFDLLGGLDDDDVLELVEAVSRLSPKAARRATKLMSGVVRTVSR